MHEMGVTFLKFLGRCIIWEKVNERLSDVERV